jgi:hypothetical protein
MPSILAQGEQSRLAGSESLSTDLASVAKDHRCREGRESGVLRRLSPHRLREPELRPVALGFEEAERVHGRSGALSVRPWRAVAGRRLELSCVARRRRRQRAQDEVHGAGHVTYNIQGKSKPNPNWAKLSQIQPSLAKDNQRGSLDFLGDILDDKCATSCSVRIA